MITVEVTEEILDEALKKKEEYRLHFTDEPYSCICLIAMAIRKVISDKKVMVTPSLVFISGSKAILLPKEIGNLISLFDTNQNSTIREMLPIRFKLEYNLEQAGV